MSKGRDITAERIANFLETARMQQRSGLLRAECTQEGKLEEGELYLVAGQPVYAHAGKLTGYEALNRLLSWRNISFSFAVDVPRPPANLSPSVASRSITSSLSAESPGTSRSPNRWNHEEKRSDFIQRGNSLPGMEQRVPRKVALRHNILNLPLTRRQRLIYFLIDGQRTIGDVARCANKSIIEVEPTLTELYQQGLISL